MSEGKPILPLRDHDACVSCHRENLAVKVFHKEEGPWCFACFPIDRLAPETIPTAPGSVGEAICRIGGMLRPDRLDYD